MKKLTHLFMLLCLPVTWALAGPVEDRLKENLQKFDPSFLVRNIQKSPLSGLYEVLFVDKRGDKQIAYSDPEGKYLILGQMVETATQRNLTQASLRKAEVVPVNELPLKSAMRWVQGNGSRTLVVLSDPLCPFCKGLEKDLEKLKDVTIYLLPLPYENVHPGTTELSLALWCAIDPSKAWRDYMLRSVAPSPARSSCKRPDDLKKVVAFAQKYNMNGTPNLIFKDGAIVRGALPLESLTLWLRDTK